MATIIDIHPAVAEDNQKFTPNAGHNPARYMVNPGVVKGENNHSPGQLRHARPYLVAGTRIFVFPVGVEGFRRSGTAGVSIHRNLNEVAVDVHVFHREEARITLRGTFPGNQSPEMMTECIAMLRSKSAAPGLTLYAPGLFAREAYVVPESWEFDHPEDDRTHSITYEITFIRTGEGQKTKDTTGKPAPPNPTVLVKPKGKPSRFYTVAQGVVTLRQMAAFLYKDANKWQQIVALNGKLIGNWQKKQIQNQINSLPSYSLPTYRWPLGTKFRY